MKTLTTLAFAIIIAFASFAQDVCVTELVTTPFEQQIEVVFQNLDHNGVTTHYLIDRASRPVLACSGFQRAVLPSRQLPASPGGAGIKHVEIPVLKIHYL